MTTVEQPDELSNLNDEITAVQEKVNEVKELAGDIEETYTEAATLDDEDRKIVAAEMPKLRQRVTDVDDLEDLKAVHDDVGDVIVDPHRQAMRQARKTVLEVLGLDTDLEIPDDEPDVTLERKSADELAAATEALEHAADRLRDVSDTARSTVATAVRETPAITYETAAEEFKPVVDTVADRYSLLEAVDTGLGKTVWASATTLAETAPLYDTEGVGDDEGTVCEYIGNIDGVVAKSNAQLPLADVLSAHVDAVLSNPETAALEKVFSDINEAVVDIHGHEDAFSHAVRMAEAMDDADGAAELSTPVSVQDRLDAIASMPDSETDREAEPLAELNTELATLTEDYEAWTTRFATTLQNDATAIEALNTIGPSWVPAFNPSETAFALLADDVTVEMVATEPDRAVATHVEYRQWVADLQTEAPATPTDEGADTVEIMVDLVRGDDVSATYIDSTAYSELQTHLEEGLTIQYSSDRGDD